ncbi:hypothetical protein BJP34_17250 [Moorena producens PAL-8-15-08-1]|uniref:Uncharacterized protein n=1 Tax=Moorena producens PAL-8-15-08-1 TaxID=1458985 RepID=A0A1D8TTJ4_9CYAN|nr:hypothetical protein BJP34_17250 [Moorena producens PAL-8-15-08-1]
MEKIGREMVGWSDGDNFRQATQGGSAVLGIPPMSDYRLGLRVFLDAVAHQEIVIVGVFGKFDQH